MATARLAPARALGECQGLSRRVRAYGGLIVVVGLLLTLFLLTFAFPQPMRPAEVAPSLWPRLLIVLLLVTAIAERVVQRRGPDTLPATPPPRLIGHGPARAGLAFVGYGLGLHYLGFLVATPLFVAAAAPIFGLKRPPAVAGLATAATLAIGIVCVGLLYLPLPRGELAFFYQLNARADALLTTLRP